MKSIFAQLVGIYLLFTFGTSCNSTGADCTEYPFNSDIIGVVADTSGNIISHFPIKGEELRTHQIMSSKLTQMDNDLIAAISYHGVSIVDLEKEQLVTSINDFKNYTTSAGSENLYFTSDNQEQYSFSSDITLNNIVTQSALKSMSISSSGDTSMTDLFSFGIRKQDSSKFETTLIVRAIPLQDDNEIAYIRENEVTSVRTDSSGENLFLNRFYFERSLWTFNTSTKNHSLISKLPDPTVEQEMESIDVSNDGNYIVYGDNGSTTLVDIPQKDTMIITQGGYDDRLFRPIISPNNNYLLGSGTSGNQFYIYQNSTGERWLAATNSNHASNYYGATFSPNSNAIYYPDFRSDDTLGIWTSDTQRRYWETNNSKEGEYFVADISNLLETLGFLSHHNSLGQPVFISDQTFFVIADFTGTANACK